jgi:hypothetical protein
LFVLLLLLLLLGRSIFLSCAERGVETPAACPEHDPGPVQLCESDCLDSATQRALHCQELVNERGLLPPRYTYRRKEGRKAQEGRKEGDTGREEGRREGRREGRKEGRKEETYR